MPRPDLVVSGVNTEYNLGLSTQVSGTAGAAREAARHGIPAIAASMSGAAFPKDLVYAAEEVVWVARRVKQWGLRTEHVPQRQHSRRAGGRLQGLHDHEAGAGAHRHRELRGDEAPIGPDDLLERYTERKSEPQPEGTDFWAVENGWVSVTPMKIDETDASQFDALRAIFK